MNISLNDFSYNDEQEWNNFFANETPMGSLLRNPLGIPKQKQLTVIHLTNNLDKIKKSKTLLSSGGGLAACIYGVPVQENGEMHNLGNYILKNELPRFLKAQNKSQNINMLAIRFNENETAKLKIEKMDYLTLGNIYLEAFERVIKDSEATFLSNVENDLIRLLKANEMFLLKINEGFKNTKEFLNYFNKFLIDFPLSRLVYFETILEYCFLFQNDTSALLSKDKKELFNPNVKDMIFSLNPMMMEKFTMINFLSIPQVISKYLEECSDSGEFILNFNKTHFYEFLNKRFTYNFKHRLMRGDRLSKLPTSLAAFKEDNSNLLGHMLFRGYKNMFDIENVIADSIWTTWSKKGLSILTYKHLPKGEIGIAPTLTNNHEIFMGNLSSTGKIELTEKLDIKVIPTLNDPKDTVMRKPYHVDNDK